MRSQLAAILPDDAALEGVWGYTLIYQAELIQGVLPCDGYLGHPFRKKAP